jgi:hypothetical protein
VQATYGIILVKNIFRKIFQADEAEFMKNLLDAGKRGAGNVQECVIAGD